MLSQSASVRMLLISILTVTVGTQPIFLLAAGSPQTGPELGFGAFALGLYATVFFLAAAVASTPAGKLVERLGWPGAMRLATVGAIASLLSIATFAHSPIVLGMLLVVAAGFYSFANPAANLALARFARPQRLGTFFGIKHAGIPGSTLLAGLAVPLINLRWGWRWSYVAAAIVGLVLIALIPRVAPSSQPGATDVAQDKPQMRRRDLRRLTVMATLVTVAPGTLGTFTVSAGVAAGLSEGAAGWTLSAAGLSTILARSLFGMWVDRKAASGIRMLVSVIAFGVVAVIGLAFAEGMWFVVATVGAFVAAWGWPGLLTYTVVEGNPGRPAEATARTQAGIFIGAGLGPLLFGWLVDRIDFQGAWLSIALALALGVAVGYPLMRRSMQE